MVLPADSEDAPQAAHVKGVQSLLLPHLGGAGLASIEQSGEDTGLIYKDFGAPGEGTVLPQSFGESCHDCASLS